MLEQKNPDKVCIEKQAEQKAKQGAFLGVRKLKPGHSVFEFDFKNMTIEKLKFECEKTANPFNKNSQRKKIIIKPYCLYINALNLKNALRKISQEFGPLTIKEIV